jgi:hypothetical protein
MCAGGLIINISWKHDYEHDIKQEEDKINNHIKTKNNS